MTLRSVRYAFVLFSFVGLLGAADPGLMSLLMPNAKVIAGINIAQAKTTPFGKFLLAQIPAELGPMAKAGFDPRRDLQEVLIGAPGPPARQGLVLVRGSFDPALIVAAAQAAGHTVETYNGVPILTGKARSGAHAIAFLGNSIAIAGDIESVRAAIERRAADSTAIDPSLAAQVEQLSQSLDAWSVSALPLSAFANEKLPDQQLNTLLSSNLLKSIQQSSGGVKFGSSVKFSGQAVADSSENATALANVVRFLGNMAQANAPAPAAAAIASLLQTLSMQTDGSTLTLAAAIPESQLETLVRDAHQK